MRCFASARRWDNPQDRSESPTPSPPTCPFQSLTYATHITGQGLPPARAVLDEVEQGRLGVLVSTHAYLFHLHIERSSLAHGEKGQPAGEQEAHQEFHLLYVWYGRAAETGARTAARAQVGCLNYRQIRPQRTYQDGHRDGQCILPSIFAPDHYPCKPRVVELGLLASGYPFLDLVGMRIFHATCV